MRSLPVPWPCPRLPPGRLDPPAPQLPFPRPVPGPLPFGPVPSALGIFVSSDSIRIVCYCLVMEVPHFGHLRSTQGTPRWCGSFSPHFGHRHVPISPAARGPPMRPRPCPPWPWPCPPPFPVPPRPFSFISYSSLFMPFIFWPRCQPRPQQPGMAKPSHSKLPLSHARMTSCRSPAANGPSGFHKLRLARASV